MNLQKMIFSAGMLFSAYYQIDAQVGINTPNPDASAALEIKSANKGVLIPRIPLVSATDAVTIPSPAKGLIVYSAGGTIGTGDGFYANYGTPAAPVWTTWQKFDNNQFILKNAYSTVATNPVNSNVGTNSTVNNINLGLSIPITIPANSLAQVVVTYSTPVGTTSGATQANRPVGYMGIRFLKNGVEAPAGSRKYSIASDASGNSGSIPMQMLSVGTSYAETITNNTGSDITITYSLNGYIERNEMGANPTNFRFNMWDVDSNPNYNWGRGTMTAQLYTKPL
ncbi:hypothetical protein [Chryseobacterium sp. ERMR1:04]|uniref:hypothetical protein n=1 Tax=Chryseobacterium sp. ERMR1:04 TaxID=1705393 RepID=UPI0006C8BA91|nr:hypothetical protein [Chryseobacterium sp. ERMR1:04]